MCERERVSVCVRVHHSGSHCQQCKSRYGVASVSRIDRITGLFCRISSLYRALLQKRRNILSIVYPVSCSLLYGLATISRPLHIIGLFCRISSLYRALLQKTLVILSILLTEGTPYSDIVCALYIVYTL